jgi:phospholipid/cholesterol/gamma-HCH transport system substrate-binding protein
MEGGMKAYTTELVVGVFVVIGVVAMAYLSIKLGDVEIFGTKGYTIYAEFDSTSGLREGAAVEMAGVEIGKIGRIQLKDYLSHVQMRIDNDVKIPDDTIASIRTSGLIGEKFVKLNTGGSDEWMEEGDKISDTESSIDIEELVSKYIFSLEK